MRPGTRIMKSYQGIFVTWLSIWVIALFAAPNYVKRIFYYVAKDFFGLNWIYMPIRC